MRPLIDLDAAVSSQATGSLSVHDRVRLGDTTRIPLLVGGLHGEPGVWLERVLACCGTRQTVTLGDLSVAVVNAKVPTDISDAATTRDFAIAGRFLVRLLNFGALELA